MSLWRADLSLIRVLKHGREVYRRIRGFLAIGRRNLRCVAVQRYVWLCKQREGLRKLSQNNITTDNTKKRNKSTAKQCPPCFQHRLSQNNITTNLTNRE